MQIALAQLNFKVGDVDDNARRIQEAIARAKKSGADLVVFSEVALLGYPPRDLVQRTDRVRRQLKALEELARETDEDFAALIGFVDFSPAEFGHRLVNAAAFCRGGVVERRIAKTLLPNYDVFDESRYFASASSLAGGGGFDSPVVTHKDMRIGVCICEDAWAKALNVEMPRYEEDPIEKLADQGAELVVNLSASPFSLNKGEKRRALLSEHCKTHALPLVFVNQVGANDELVFDGRSLALGADGEVVARLSEFAEDFVVVEAREGTLRADDKAPIKEAGDTPAKQIRGALVTGIRDYVEKSGFRSVILGLSGGIDSALVATLAAEALGPENVFAVAMPSRFSSQHSRDDAHLLAKNLGIGFEEIPIEGPYQAMLDALEPHFGGRPFDVTEENLQARIRGVYLMALSNKLGHLLLACGNKSELAVGYSTLYGDLNGALAPIGDVPKMLVYEVARLYNQEAGREVVPENILSKAPSAELRPDQTDQDSLPPYDLLDRIVELYVEEKREISAICAEGFEEETVRRIVKLIHIAEYKRWQAPPILKVTRKAFGVGWRYPLAASFT